MVKQRVREQEKRSVKKNTEREEKKEREPWSVTQYRRKCHVDKCNTVRSISYSTDYVKQLPCALVLVHTDTHTQRHTDSE